MNAPRPVKTSNIEDALADAYSVADELLDEMQTWNDGLPENLRDSNTGQLLDAAVSELENVSGGPPELPEILPPLRVPDPKLPKRASRADRASYAADILRAVADEIRQWMDVNREAHEQAEVDTSECECVAGDLEDHADTLEGIEWPRMFGG